MNMKKRLAAMMMMASIMDIGNQNYGSSFSDKEVKSEEEKELDQEKIRLKQGQKKFWYGSNYVWALSQKRADKKAKKLGYFNL